MANIPTVPRTENFVQKPTPSGPKPCCVCKDEKASRDECFLLTEDAETKCLDKVAAYKACMAGFGFKV
ncbi:cytochrome C oxidase copper chaperone Cox17 [Tuber magnatum]|uniref:Cytochrome C oxidase copper chaperone Cox17 n=1 Tax=Tuber magnatum TaxID=42249 RepID=A0A317SXW6_9PEZI|nr:cytochrome C oxidase copper chaperone Cox17 [Tuber magnatum]